jgi:hypothetical protein
MKLEIIVRENRRDNQERTIQRNGEVCVAHRFSFLCCVFGGVRVAHLFSFLCCVFGWVRVAHRFSFLCCVFETQHRKLKR